MSADCEWRTFLLNGTKLQAGDGAAVSEESVVKIRSSRSSELLLFELN